jgi:hypothetical protein
MRPYWFQESKTRFLRADGCETIFECNTGSAGYWTAMVPYPSEQSCWVALMESNQKDIQKFQNPDDAIKAVEDYLTAYSQFIAKNSLDIVDLATGPVRVSGGNAISSVTGRSPLGPASDL